jgi:polyribonucleotide nucleotidyltransferase|tara:strand:+ start:140 stop:343 length:204 start_codon:yes stop_codon:yes gene_type:complete
MKYKNIEEQEEAIKKSQEEHTNTLTDSRIEKLEKRVKKLENEIWKRNLQEDHVRYDFIGDISDEDVF